MMKKIALIAPSSPAPELTPQAVQTLRDLFATRGYQIWLGPHARDTDRYLAGTDADRAADVLNAFTDDSVSAVMTVRGGYGSPRLLDRLDYAHIARHPKPFLAFSDGTALQNALYTRAGITGYSGGQATFFLHENRHAVCQSVWDVLAGQPLTIAGLTPVRGGVARGVALGGNLVVWESLIGTPYCPDMRGKILILEEVNESPYKVDRMLAHLRLAGILDQVAGVALGDFSTCVARDPTDGGIEAVLHDYFDSLSVPVVRGLPYGHTRGTTVVPIGRRVMLDADNGLFKEEA